MINNGPPLVDWQDRIAVNSKVLVGKPVIKGTRISVAFLMELVASGWTHEQILKNHPHVTEQDIHPPSTMPPK